MGDRDSGVDWFVGQEDLTGRTVAMGTLWHAWALAAAACSQQQQDGLDHFHFISHGCHVNLKQNHLSPVPSLPYRQKGRTSDQAGWHSSSPFRIKDSFWTWTGWTGRRAGGHADISMSDRTCVALFLVT